MRNKISTYFSPVIFFAFAMWMVISADLNRANFLLDFGKNVPYGDKIGHFLLFGIMALLVNMAIGFKQIKIRTRRFHLGSVLVLAFAVCEEFTQLAFHTRTFDLVDMLFDLFGIGLFSSVAFRKYLVKRIKSFTKYLSNKLLVE